MIKKLRRRFIGIGMFSIFLVLFLIVGIINTVNFASLNDRINNILNVLGENNGTFPPYDESLPIEEEDPYAVRYFTVTLNESGVLKVDAEKVVKITEEEAAELASSLYSQNIYYGYHNDWKYKAFDNDSGAKMYIFVDSSRYTTSYFQLLRASLLISFVGLTLVFILVYWLSKAVFRPVADSFEKQKLFITNASHELKTPLAVINANNEILEMEHGEEERTKSTRKQIAGMNELIKRLILLSKLDEGEKQTYNKLNLSDVLINVKNNIKSLEMTMNKKVEVTIQEDIYIKGSEKELFDLFMILMENSLKYAKEEIPIKTCLVKRKKMAVFTLENESDNFKTGNLNYLFERFYRSDNDSNKSGFGIGLSIAKMIVANHKGKINCECLDNRHVVFTIYFPLVKE